jgi:Lipopolysaccharide-assembly
MLVICKSSARRATGHFPFGMTGLLLAWLALTCLIAGCAGYQVGSQNLYRYDVRTIHVPIVQSDSLRRFMGERLTEAIITQIESQSHYKVVSLENADSVLYCQILADNKRVLSETINDDPRSLQAELRVETNWVSRTGQPLFPRQVLRINGTSLMIPEAGSSLATAQQEVIDRIAKDIVQQMEMPW